MFCMQCGKELPNDARFCSQCGSPQPASSGGLSLVYDISDILEPEESDFDEPDESDFVDAEGWTDPIRRRDYNLDVRRRDYSLGGLYTLDWRGTCPSCKMVHTPKNLGCPNDHTPVVVAFDDYYFVLKRYPIHAATLRCLHDCGLSSMAFPCTNCGAGIAGRNIVFRFGILSRFSHFMFQFMFCCLFLIFLGATFSAHPLFALPTYLTFRVVRHFRPFGRFNFAQVPRAARKYAKEVDRKDAIRNAKAVAANRGFFASFLNK